MRGVTAVPNYHIWRQVGLTVRGVLVGKAQVRGSVIVGAVAPELADHRPRVLREIATHAAGPFADMAVRVCVGGATLWIAPVEPPPLPPRPAAVG